MTLNLFIQSLVSGVFTGILFGGIAVSLAICNLADRSLHVAIGAIISLVAYFWLFTIRGDISVVTGVFALVVAALGANLACLAIYRWLDRLGVSSDGVIVASFGLLIAGNAILELAWGTEPFSLRAAWLQGNLRIGFVRIAYVDMITGLAVLVLMAGLWAALRFGGLSLQLRSVFHDSREAAIAGVNIPLIQVLAYSFGAALIVIIALAIGSRASVSPHMGFFPLLVGIAALLTGGLGSVRSAFLSGIAMGMIWDVVGISFGAIWQFSAVFGILATVLLTAPTGLFSINFAWMGALRGHGRKS